MQGNYDTLMRSTKSVEVLTTENLNIPGAEADFVWIQLLICAVVLVMVPFYRLDKEMPAVRTALAHEGEETAR